MARLTVIAHLLGVSALILLLVWLLHFCGGIGLDSDNTDRIFNVHPFLMFGFIFLVGEAIMAYQTVTAEKRVKKFVHMVIHLVAVALGIIGLYAVFKYHNEESIPDMTSLHSWLGIGTFCVFGLQWLFGFICFWYPRVDEPRRMKLLPWHICGGKIVLYMAICTAESGLMQKATSTEEQSGTESRLMNFTGLAILLFGIAVDVSTVPRHQLILP